MCSYYFYDHRPPLRPIVALHFIIPIVIMDSGQYALVAFARTTREENLPFCVPTLFITVYCSSKLLFVESVRPRFACFVTVIVVSAK